MSVIDQPQERAWAEGEASTVALMGSINVAVAELVATIRRLIDTEGWHGAGIQSVEHWLTWKGGVARSRAAGLVRIARRVHELPACWACSPPAASPRTPWFESSVACLSAAMRRWPDGRRGC